MAGLKLPGSGTKPVTLYGNPVLRERCRPVRDFDKRLRTLVDQLVETMYATDTGVGLAANQIGRTERVFVFDCGDDMVGHVVNPVVEPIGTEIQDGVEGCLSLPGFALATTRALRARVTGFDVHGDPVTYEGEGLAARCFQHEVDHLDGTLYIDHHPADVQATMDADLRLCPWFGRDALHPNSPQYRRADA
ncbi:MAG: peptide deformylase [Acidimicrobiales bacterium]